jgi:hypothetical protein
MNIAAALIAVVVGLFAATTIYQVQKFKWRSEGAQVERARVERSEAKIDAKIAKKQRAIADKPASGVLDRWQRD